MSVPVSNSPFKLYTVPAVSLIRPQGLVAIDNEDVTVIVIMNGMNVFRGKPEHSMKRFIQAKKRALEEGGGQGSSSKPKHAE